MENFKPHQKSNGCARRTRKLCGEAHWGGDLRRRMCKNALELRGKRSPVEFPGQAIARESTLAKGDGVMGALGCRERVLFIGTEFSILYTSMHSPA